jgi:hypothetical protein
MRGILVDIQQAPKLIVDLIMKFDFLGIQGFEDSKFNDSKIQ